MLETFDLIVRGGELINHAGRGVTDIGIRNGKFARLGDLSHASASISVDARGLLVMPGVMDTQVHFREPGLEYKEDLKSGSEAAVLGGVVAVFEMPNTNPNTASESAFLDKMGRAKGRMYSDHAFYMGGTIENAAHLGELERLPGCCGVKVFMGASTGTLLIAEDEGLKAVLASIQRRAAFHAEDVTRNQLCWRRKDCRNWRARRASAFMSCMSRPLKRSRFWRRIRTLRRSKLHHNT